MSSKQLNRKEGFWPFDDWFPEDPEDPNGKVGGDLGDRSDNFSIKNYPAFSRAPIGRRIKSENQIPAVKRSTGKKSS